VRAPLHGTGAHTCEEREFHQRDVGTEGFVMHKDQGVLYPIYVKVQNVIRRRAVVATIRQPNGPHFSYHDMFDSPTIVKLCMCNWLPTWQPGGHTLHKDGQACGLKLDLYAMLQADVPDDMRVCTVAPCTLACHSMATTRLSYETCIKEMDTYTRMSGICTPPNLPICDRWDNKIGSTGVAAHYRGQVWDVVVAGVARCGAPVVVLTRRHKPFYIVSCCLLYEGRCGLTVTHTSTTCVKIGGISDKERLRLDVEEACQALRVPVSSVLTAHNVEVINVYATNQTEKMWQSGNRMSGFLTL
jgi:hypothetical protein